MLPSLTNKESAGGLGVAIEESLKRNGGVWFGWSGEISNEKNIEPEVLKNDNVTYVSLKLSPENYENFYNGYNDLIKQRWFNNNGQLHRNRGPAEISYRFNADKNTMEIEEQIYYENGRFKQRSNDKPNMIINDGFGINKYTLDPNGRTISIRRSGMNIPTMFGNTARICRRKQRKRVNKRAK